MSGDELCLDHVAKPPVGDGASIHGDGTSQARRVPQCGLQTVRVGNDRAAWLAPADLVPYLSHALNAFGPGALHVRQRLAGVDSRAPAMRRGWTPCLRRVTSFTRSELDGTSGETADASTG